MTNAECLFCRIVQGTIPARKLLETETVLAFLDIAPVRPGHALVIPKTHYETILDIPAALAADLFGAIGRLGRAVMTATGSGGFNLGVNTYAAAGQLVPHAHFHIIPRAAGDGLTLWPSAPYPSGEAADALAASIKNALS